MSEVVALVDLFKELQDFGARTKNALCARAVLHRASSCWCVLQRCTCDLCESFDDRYFRASPGGTPIYWLYGYVPLERVWFSSHLVWYRV